MGATGGLCTVVEERIWDGMYFLFSHHIRCPESA